MLCVFVCIFYYCQPECEQTEHARTPVTLSHSKYLIIYCCDAHRRSQTHKLANTQLSVVHSVCVSAKLFLRSALKASKMVRIHLLFFSDFQARTQSYLFYYSLRWNVNSIGYHPGSLMGLDFSIVCVCVSVCAYTIHADCVCVCVCNIYTHNAKIYILYYTRQKLKLNGK